MANIESCEGRAFGLAPRALHLSLSKRPHTASELRLLQVQA
jgi:hypothetical protein